MTEQLTMHADLGTDGLELLTIEADTKANRCTASCLDARVELRAAILEALAQGMGTRTVASAFKVSREVVRALVKQVMESGELDQVKQRLGRDAFALAHSTLGRIRDELDEMPRASLPIVYGVLIDKAQLLTGGATARVIHEQKPADINALVDSLPSAERVDAGENLGQKALPVAADATLVPPSSSGRENQSRVSGPSSEGEPISGSESGQTDHKKDAA